MFLSKLNSRITAVLLGGALVSGGLGLVRLPGVAAQAPQPPQAKDSPPPSLKEPPGIKKVAALKPVVVKQDAQIQRVVWSPDDKLVATVGTRLEVVEARDSDGKNPQKVLVPQTTIKLWDATSGELKKSLGEEKDTDIYAIAFSPDKKRLVLAGAQHSLVGGKPGRGDFVRFLTVGTWAVELELDDPSGVHHLAFSPDGKTLAMGGGSHVEGAFVKLWDVAGEKIIGGTKPGAPPAAVPELGKKPKGLEVLNGLEFSPDGKTLAAGKFSLDSKQAMIELFDGKTGESTAKWDVGESKGMFQVAFTAEGKRLLSACGAVTLWDLNTKKQLTTLVTEDDQGIRLRPPSKNSLLERKDQGFFQVAASPVGGLLATTRVRKEKDKSIAEVDVWKAHDGESPGPNVWLDPGLWVRTIAFSHDGKTLAIGTQTDADVRVEGSEKVKGELRLVSVNRDR
jgi:WD40 repeat protein